MIIGGLDKVSLIDYPGKISCVIFTQGCNFRCYYCHNSELVIPEMYSSLIPTEYVKRFLERRKHVLDGVVITGGEPTIHDDLIQFIREIKSYGYSIKLDSNGSNFIMLKNIIEEGLVDYVAMDVKAPLHRYKELFGGFVNTDEVRASLELIKKVNIQVEFRTTLIDELSSEDILEIKELIGPSNTLSLNDFQRSGKNIGEVICR